MTRLLACALCLLSLQVTGAAHVLDQYVQSARIALAPTGVRVDLRLTPGAQVADAVFALMDGDGDGQLSPEEEQGYARRVLREIALDVDGRRAALTLAAVQFPSRTEMREGLGAIRFEFLADAAFAAGEHEVAFRNEHQPELGVYLANALVPEDSSIRITGQERDALQQGLRIHFTIAAAASMRRRVYELGGIGALIAGSGLAWSFLKRKKLR